MESWEEYKLLDVKEYLDWYSIDIRHKHVFISAYTTKVGLQREQHKKRVQASLLLISLDSRYLI